MRIWPVVILLLLGTTLSLAVPRRGLHIGTKRAANDVASNGEAKPEWKPQSEGGSKVMSSGDIGVSLHFSLEPNPLAGSDQNYTMSIITSDADVLVVEPAQDEGWLDIDTYDEVAHYAVYCKKLGAAEIRMQVNLPEPAGLVYDPITLGLNKTCRPCIMEMARGRNPGVGDVLKGCQPAADYNYIAGSNEDNTFYTVWLPNVPGGMTEQRFAVRFEANNDVLNPTALVTPEPAVARPIEHLGSGTSVQVYYRCKDRPESIVEKFTMIINVGWADPVKIPLTKVCGPEKKPSGWSPAGIFFFSVFIITLVLCITGCGWNYVKNNRTGLDMVPGIDLFRGCWARIAGQKPYTPQTNYDEENSSSLNRGYQTDL